jgi:MFS family permease
MRHALPSVAAILMGIGLVSVGLGLLGTFLAVRLGMAKLDDLWIGVVVTGYPLGFLAGCLTARVPIDRVGAIRAFAALGGLMTAATLSFTLTTEPVAWTCLRIINGFCAAGLFTIAESWLNARTPPASRGAVLAAYMISDKLTYAIGQMLIEAADPAGPVLFAIAAIAFALCLVPVALTSQESPITGRAPGLSIVALFRVSPLGVVATFASGLINTTIISLAPIWASNHGLDTADIARFMTGLMLGGLVLQWPIGYLSDRIDRRRVLLGVALATTALAFVIAATGDAPADVLIALGALFGGACFAIYPLAVAHANDFADRSQAVQVSSGLLLSWAIGSVVGPPLASLLVARIGQSGLFVHATIVAALLVAFTLWRMARRAPVPNELQGKFVPLSQTAPAGRMLNPRAD